MNARANNVATASKLVYVCTPLLMNKHGYVQHMVNIFPNPIIVGLQQPG